MDTTQQYVMNRRKYLTAIASITGTTIAGCTGAAEMTQEEAKNTFDDVTEFEVPFSSDPAQQDSGVWRFVDRDAGVVLYWTGEGNEGGLSSQLLSETDLD